MRFAVLCHTTTLRGWQKKAIDRLIQEGEHELVCIMVCRAPHKADKQPLLARARQCVFKCFDALDTLLCGRLDKQLKTVDTPFDIQQAYPKALFVEPSGTALPEFKGGARPDFALSFLPFDPPTSLVRVFVQGVLFLSCSGVFVSGARCAHFWKWFEKALYVDVHVAQVRGEGGAYFTRAQGRYRSLNYLWNAQRRAMLFHSEPLLHDAVRAIERGAAEKPFISHPFNDEYPALKQWPLIVVKMVMRLFETFVFIIRKDYWHFGVSVQENPSLDLRQLKPVRHNDYSFFGADPFALVREDRIYVFGETILKKQTKGTISCIQLDLEGHYLEHRVIIEDPYHLSYPFYFEYEDALYIVMSIPDCKEIRLYRCRDFPYEWRCEKVLLRAAAVDTSLHCIAGVWWMFTNIDRVGRDKFESEMSLFYADSPLSETWTPHPLNPVVKDASCARNAGGVFALGGRFYRVSQGLDKGFYGSNASVYEIITLDTASYYERRVQDVCPRGSSLCDGTHHMCLREFEHTHGVQYVVSCDFRTDRLFHR